MLKPIYINSRSRVVFEGPKERYPRVYLEYRVKVFCFYFWVRVNSMFLSLAPPTVEEIVKCMKQQEHKDTKNKARRLRLDAILAAKKGYYHDK